MDWRDIIRESFKIILDGTRKAPEKEELDSFEEYEEVETSALIGEANSKIIHRPKSEKLFKNL